MSIICSSHFLSSLWTLVPIWNELQHGVGFRFVFVLCEVEQLRKRLPIWQSCIRITKLIKIWVKKGAKWRWSGLWVVLEQLRNKVDGFLWRSMSEHLVPRKRPDLRKSVLFVVGVHRLNLLLRWSSQDLNDFH